MESMQHTKFNGLFYVKRWEVKGFMLSLVRPSVLNSGFRRYLFKYDTKFYGLFYVKNEVSGKNLTYFFILLRHSFT